MNSKELQAVIDKWIHFAPYLGVNVSVTVAKSPSELNTSSAQHWHGATGYTDIAPLQLIATNQRVYIYSITKTFTAIIIMRLVEQGMLDLDASFNHYLRVGNLPDSITLRHLLNHTSGVPSYTDDADYVPATRRNPSQSWSFADVINKTCKGDLNFEPGDKWHYSNTGYMLLLLLIEAITKESYANNLQRYIATPLGLQETYLAEHVDNNIKLTLGWGRQLNDDWDIEKINQIYDPWWCKTGLIVSTTQETNRVYAALFGGTLLSENSLDEMMIANVPEIPTNHIIKNPSYGLGLMIEEGTEYGDVYQHGGSGPGFNTLTSYYPNAKGKSVVVSAFSNTEAGMNPFMLVNKLMRTSIE